MGTERTIKIYTDGGSRGNPGPAALGVFVTDWNGEVLYELGENLGITTNNVAEYTAVVRALEWANKYVMDHAVDEIAFFMDSQLVMSQLNGLYKVKHPMMRSLLFKVREQEGTLKIPITYTHIPREQNKQADRMVNLALDHKL